MLNQALKASGDLRQLALKDRDSLRRGLGAADVPWFASELPVQRAFVPAFYIGRTEVTAAAFWPTNRQSQPAWQSFLPQAQCSA